MRRNTSLPRLSSHLTSAVAALATCWSTSSALAQEAGLPTPPPVTAVGSDEIIQTGLRPGRPGLASRLANAAAARESQSNNNTPSAPAVPAVPVPENPMPATPTPVAGNQEQFLSQLDLAINVSSKRFLTANVHSPWQIFHGLLALKQDFQLNLNGSKVNAIQWIATSEPRFDNQPLLMKTAHGGKFHAFTRPYAFEGHPAQFLALLSQSDLPVGFTFKVGPDHITLGDIINNTMKEVNTHEEVTWVLWGLQHYLKPDTQWVNQHNEAWSIERLVQIETNSPVVGAPCGGNHRLFALVRTRDKHLKSGGKLVGVWAQADHKVRQHVEIARSLQNYDGSFSSKFYETSGFTNDLNQRFNTTGHTMEFLSIGLPNERLNEPWVRNAVAVLCNDLIVNRQRQIDCGPLYHTLNSLIIYRERFRALHPESTTTTAQSPTSKAPITGSRPSSVPSLGLNPIPVTTKPAFEAKPVTTDKPVPTVESPMPTKPQPSAEALNELKLDEGFREKLNALRTPRPLPGIMPPDTEARPLDSTGQPHLQEGDNPTSALSPENGG